MRALQSFYILNYFIYGLSCGNTCPLQLAFRPLLRVELQRVKASTSVLVSPARRWPLLQSCTCRPVRNHEMQKFIRESMYPEANQA
jgi:hypothetical protein